MCLSTFPLLTLRIRTVITHRKNSFAYHCTINCAIHIIFRKSGHPPENSNAKVIRSVDLFQNQKGVRRETISHHFLKFRWIFALRSVFCCLIVEQVRFRALRLNQMVSTWWNWRIRKPEHILDPWARVVRNWQLQLLAVSFCYAILGFSQTWWIPVYAIKLMRKWW